MNRSCISISISMSAVFLSAEKHLSRVQSRSKNAKKCRLNLKKNWQRLYENIPLYNKQSPNFKDKSKEVLSQDELCEPIYFSFLLLVISLLFFFVVVKEENWMTECKYTCAKCKYTCAVAIKCLCLCCAHSHLNSYVYVYACACAYVAV